MQTIQVLKITLIVLIAASISPLLAFAEPSIELTSDQKNIGSLDSVLVIGMVTGVEPYSTVNLTVTAPDGETVYSPNVPFDDEGNFKRLIHPPLPSFKPGIYTIVASHDQIDYTVQIQFTVTAEDIPRTPISDVTDLAQVEKMSDSAMHISANAVIGDTNIDIHGKTVWIDRDVTLKVSSPKGNLIAVAQVTPTINGDFSTTIKIGGPLWKEDGMYTVTAYQDDSSELQDSVEVEIAEGVVVPEFGTVAAIVLALSMVSLIALSAKSRLGIFPRF